MILADKPNPDLIIAATTRGGKEGSSEFANAKKRDFSKAHCSLILVMCVLLLGCGKAGGSLSGDWQAAGKHMFGTYALNLSLESNGKCRAVVDYVTKPTFISLASVQQIELSGTWKEQGSGIAIDLRVDKWQKTADGESEQIEAPNCVVRDGFALTDDGRLIRAWINFQQNPDAASDFDKGERIMLNAIDLSRVP